MTRRISKRSGFSLIEVLVAVVLLSVGLVGIMEGITLTLASSRDEELHTVAVMLAEGHLEQLRSDGFLFEGEDDGDFGADFPRFRWRRKIEETSLSGLHDVSVSVELAETEHVLYQLITQIFETPPAPLEDEDQQQDPRRSKRRGRGL